MTDLVHFVRDEVEEALLRNCTFACLPLEKLSGIADLIEKLEAALRDCMEMAEVHEIPFRDRVMYISDIARKALEGKDD